jgi:hypothetical protein
MVGGSGGQRQNHSHRSAAFTPLHYPTDRSASRVREFFSVRMLKRPEGRAPLSVI